MNIRNVTLTLFFITAACSSAAEDMNDGSDGDGDADSGGTGGSSSNTMGGRGGNAAGGKGGQQSSGGKGGMGGSSGGVGGSASMGGQGGGSADCPSAAAPTANLKLRFLASTLDGENVGAWTDQVSQVQAAQGESARRPALRSNALNGKPVVRFDGDDDFLSFTFPVTGKDKMSVVTIGRTWELQPASPNADCGTEIGKELNCSGTDQTFLTWNEGGGAFKSAGIFIGVGQAEATFRFGTERDYRFFKTPFVLEKPPGDAFIWSAAIMDGVWRTLYINNEIPRGRTDYRSTTQHELRTRADQNSAGAMQAGWPSAVGDTSPTAWIGKGRFSNELSHWAGEIAELLIYESALSDAERTQLSNYVKCMYGL